MQRRVQTKICIVEVELVTTGAIHYYNRNRYLKCVLLTPKQTQHFSFLDLTAEFVASEELLSWLARAVVGTSDQSVSVGGDATGQWRGQTAS